MAKVGIISLGCAKNQVDSEVMLAKIEAHGHKLSANLDDCDVVIINTCTFIESAKAESIENIMEAAQLKKEGKIKKIIVCGCMSERYKDQIEDELFEADAFLGTSSYSKIIEAIDSVLEDKKYKAFDDVSCGFNTGERVLSTPPYSAYLKVSEGCSNKCTYCVIPNVRGEFRSRPFEDVIEEAKKLAKDGVKELMVIAQDTTRYGEDLYGERKISTLLKELCKIEQIKWVRLLYCYPSRIDDELLETIANNDKIVKYIDVPLQHSSKKVLRDMNRAICAENIDTIIEHIRQKIKDVVIRTTFIVGFPGESEEDFTELCEYVKKNKFERMGAFAYSREEDTKAYDMPFQIDEQTKNKRVEVLMDIQHNIVDKQLENQIGKNYTVLTEGYDKYAECYFGRSYGDAPDVDPKVFFTSEKPVLPGEFVDVEITDYMDYDMIGVRKGE